MYTSVTVVVVGCPARRPRCFYTEDGGEGGSGGGRSRVGRSKKGRERRKRPGKVVPTGPVQRVVLGGKDSGRGVWW